MRPGGWVALGALGIGACSSTPLTTDSSSGSSGSNGSSGSSGDVDAGPGCTGAICGGACVDTTNDAKNCGACAKTCGAGSTCTAGGCRCSPAGAVCEGTCDLAAACHTSELLEAPRYGVGRPYSFAVGTDYVVMTASAGKQAEVSRVGFDNTTKKVLSVFQGANVVAADGGDYAFAHGYIENAIEPSNVWACSGTSCSRIVSNHAAIGLQIYNGSVYWIEAGALYRCPLSGCNDTPQSVVATPGGAFRRLRIDSTGAYALFDTTVSRWNGADTAWTPLLETTGEFALDETTVYAASGDTIVTCPKSGCGNAPTTFATTTNPRGLAVKGSTVHWISGAGNPSLNGDLMRCPKASPCVPSKIGTDFPSMVLDDATHLYFATSTELAAVLRYSK